MNYTEKRQRSDGVPDSFVLVFKKEMVFFFYRL